MWPFTSRDERVKQHRAAIAAAQEILAEYATPEAWNCVPLEYRSAVYPRFDSMRESVKMTDANNIGNPELLAELGEDIAVVRVLARGTPLDDRRWGARVRCFNSLFEDINGALNLARSSSSPTDAGAIWLAGFGSSSLKAGEEALDWFRARDLQPGLKLSVGAAEALLGKLREALARQ